MIKYISFIVICCALTACDPCDDDPVCSPNPKSSIVVKFDMDSLNGGFTESELKNLYTTPANKPLDDLDTVALIDYITNNKLYHIIYSFYCCDYNGAKIINYNTNSEHIFSEINFDKKKVKCCGTDYFIKDFKYNGVKMIWGDTLVIKNN